ncbi:MAG: TIGR04002 family protein [Clostridia bacterium]
MKTKNITFTAILAALVFVATAYLFHIPVGNGYIHIGDAFVFLAGCLLPKPYAILASIIGATLADGLTGYAIWIVPTAIIKGLTTAVFTSKSEKIICKTNIFGLFLSLVIGSVGYYIAGAIIFGDTIISLASFFSSFLQTGASAVVFVFIGKALDKIDIKSMYFKEKNFE